MRRSLLVSSIILSVIFTLISFNSKAQSNDKILLAGKILNKESKIAVAFSNLYINDSRKGVVADDTGLYRIYVNAGDSLRITAIGYKDEIYHVPSNLTEDTFQNIDIKQTSYVLSDVNVYNMGTFAQFKQEILHMKIVKTEKDKLVEKVSMNICSSIRRSLSENPIPVSAGISFGKPYAQRVKERRDAYAKVEKKNRILLRKYNKEIVAKIIDENDEARLDKFLVYVNTNSSFTHRTTEKNIIQTVRKLYSKFLILYPKEITCKRDTTA
ncbi:MAG: carboxypeptidase-like regulatory domain-containing protein [Marinifilaceae bacterium]